MLPISKYGTGKSFERNKGGILTVMGLLRAFWENCAYPRSYYVPVPRFIQKSTVLIFHIPHSKFRNETSLFWSDCWTLAKIISLSFKCSKSVHKLVSNCRLRLEIAWIERYSLKWLDLKYKSYDWLSRFSFYYSEAQSRNWPKTTSCYDFYAESKS